MLAGADHADTPRSVWLALGLSWYFQARRDQTQNLHQRQVLMGFALCDRQSVLAHKTHG